MTYLVHINPTPGKDDRVVEVEAEDLANLNGTLGFVVSINGKETCVACFAPGIWNYAEPKK